MESKKINALDLFAGAGGLSLGMEQAGINVVAAIEYDKKIVETYRFNHKDTYIINDDIRNVPILKEEVTSESQYYSIEQIFKQEKKNVDLIFGGPPCQGFSMSGYRIRNKKPFFEDERNLLYLEFINVVEKLKPKVFMIENVPGILTFDDGNVQKEIIKRFSEIGYNVHADILSAEKFGVPQKRKRAIFIGNNLGIESSEFFPNKILFSKKVITVQDAIGDLPSLKSGEGYEPMDYLRPPCNDYQRYMRENNKINKVYNHISAKHKSSTIELLKLIKPGETMKDLPQNMRTKSIHSGAYGRMDPNEPAYTITTRLNTPSVGRITHPTDHRTITPREAARLQSYPDDYVFLGDITTVGMQIGNSVPPILAKEIGKSIKNIFEKI